MNSVPERAPFRAAKMVAGAPPPPRPRSLAEVARLSEESDQIDAWLAEFLDEFYAQPNPEMRGSMLQAEPRLLANPRANAYLGAVAEHLAWRDHLPVPEWAGAAPRFLHHPFFPAGLESLKATLLVESPTAFRRRMIFVGADPLYRPRRDKLGIG